MISCYLCSSTSLSIRNGEVRDNPSLIIQECNDCGLVFLSGDFKIDEDHYANSGMHGHKPLEISKWLQETDFDDERRFQFIKSKLVGKSVLDFGCGVGGFLLKSKFLTSVSKGIELEQRLQSHFKSNSLEVWSNLEEGILSKEKFDLITAFHVVEHLTLPIETINQLSEMLSDRGELLVEVPSSNDALLTLYKSDEFSRFTYWSQHLFLFNNFTLKNLISKTKLKVKWLKQIQRYPLSNHLYWLSQGEPGGHRIWSFLDNKVINDAYEAQLASAGLCDTLLVSVSR